MNGNGQEGSPGPAQAALIVGSTYILATLSLAQFINTYDTTAMNVAISRVVVDLHTTVAGVQSALTLYALIMAAGMITGGKLGDIWGKKKMFTIGITLYGVGAFVTAISTGLPMMIIGWSVLEGLGSALMIPAIYSLIPAIFKEPAERTKAFSTIGSVAGAGAAMGPLLCGIITTYLSWRASFAAEVVIVIVVLVMARRLRPPSQPEGARSSTSSAWPSPRSAWGCLCWGSCRPTSSPSAAGLQSWFWRAWASCLSARSSSGR